MRLFMGPPPLDRFTSRGPSSCGIAPSASTASSRLPGHHAPHPMSAPPDPLSQPCCHTGSPPLPRAHCYRGTPPAGTLPCFVQCLLMSQTVAIRGVLWALPCLCLHSVARPPQCLIQGFQHTWRHSAVLHSTARTAVPSGPAGQNDPQLSPDVSVSRHLTCCLAREPTDIGGPALMPPFFPASGDHLGPPPGLYLEDILWAQKEQSGHVSAICTSQAMPPRGIYSLSAKTKEAIISGMQLVAHLGKESIIGCPIRKQVKKNYFN
ncbi:hypothetical protein NDU88_002079 [Pleurodeles waltl]|uniref:Uncharacterized protein n=1 Tax=Pleurodeles waltl TaxID=8319 RepID=A0AAV7T2B7_PLEWA|nr:hypothetical protein NDU88_002079 [Pleurodeles waltl]